jgi:dihydrofolate reductase
VRKLVAYYLVSLDGVAEDPFDFIPEWDETLEDNLGRTTSTQDAVVLGRRTYDEWAAFWPGKLAPFSGFINPVKKYVATSTPLTDQWINASVIDDDLATFVGQLKGQNGGDIGVHGSISLTQTLLDAELVDELRLVVAPAVHMHGRKLFDGTVARQFLLARCETSPGGFLMVDYQMRRQVDDENSGGERAA